MKSLSEIRRAAYFKNPIGLQNILKRTVCPTCNKEFGVGQFAKHFPVCDPHQPCLHCSKARGNNPKFCCQSCAASYNNLLRPPKHNKPCAWCSNITTNKRFCSTSCGGNHRRHETETKALAGVGKGTGIRRILLKTQNNGCATCKNDTWLDRAIHLELDHIDGNADNWAPTNLRLICPNCHSQTPTFKAKNKGSGRFKRRLRYALLGEG